MPTWKKVIVSGSNISQLNNDANYLTAATLGQANGFATMSINGVSVIADSITGSLVFASSSGAGLNIVGTSAPDTITFTLTAIPTSSLLNSGSIIGSTPVNLGTTVTTLAGLSSVTSTTFVGTLTGTAATASNITPAITNNTDNQILTATGGGTINGEANLTFNGTTLDVRGTGGITTNQTTFPLVNTTATTVNFAGAATTLSMGAGTGTTTVNNSLVVTGDLTVNGTTTIINTDNLLVEDRFILVASGSTTNTDGGIVVQNAAAGVGTAFYYDGNDQRWAVNPSVAQNATAVTANSYLVSVSGSAANPSGNPLYGAADASRIGAMYVNTSDESIWIWS